jgi:hypothetical protein
MSTFEARTRTVLARELLARLAARYEQGGERLDVRVGSPAWLRAQALAAVLESLDLQAAGAADQILPDRATGPHLAEHATLAEVLRPAGASEETWRARVLAWWREAMAPMGAADWIALLEQHEEVRAAFVYPGVDPDLTAVDTRGCTTLVVLGALQGEATSPPVPDVAAITSFLDGTAGTDGSAETGPERRPLCAHPDSVRVVAPLGTGLSITFSVANDPQHPFPWTGMMTRHAAAPYATTTSSVSVDGDHTAKVGLPMLVNVGPTAARGGYVRVVPLSATYNSGDSVTTFTLAASSLPVLGSPADSDVLPCPPNWHLIRAGIFGVFDALGPGDTSPSRRFPAPTAAQPATLYPGALSAAVLAVEGVINVTHTLSTPSTPGALVRNTTGTLKVVAL